MIAGPAGPYAAASNRHRRPQAMAPPPDAAPPAGDLPCAAAAAAPPPPLPPGKPQSSLAVARAVAQGLRVDNAMPAAEVLASLELSKASDADGVAAEVGGGGRVAVARAQAAGLSLDRLMQCFRLCVSPARLTAGLLVRVAVAHSKLPMLPPCSCTPPPAGRPTRRTPWPRCSRPWWRVSAGRARCVVEPGEEHGQLACRLCAATLNRPAPSVPSAPAPARLPHCSPTLAGLRPARPCPS